DDGILETRLLKSDLPIVDTLYHMWHPLPGHSRIDVKHDGLLRFYGFSAQIGCQFLLLVYQSPPLDEGYLFRGIQAIGIIGCAKREITHTAVSPSDFHRRLGQQEPG